MKKVLLVVGALVVVCSGVAMVSAYEAHVVNVKATVENALYLPTVKVEYGTVFPEEWLTKTFKVKHSTSFCSDSQGGRDLSNTNVDTIEYSVYVLRKPVEDPAPVPYPDPVENIGGVNHYYWLGDALYLGIFDMTNPEDIPAGEMYPQGAPGQPDGVLVHVTSSTLPVLNDSIIKPAYGAPDHNFDTIVVGLDVPVFDGYRNANTDVSPKPSGLYDPTVTLTGDRNVQGIVLGADIVIQATNIYKWQAP